MLDPVPPPAFWLSTLVTPISNTLSFPTLPLHIHELIASFLFYQCVQTIVSPLLSAYLFPTIYPNLNRRTKINWDVHVVSLVQSCSINAAALWVMYVDEERKDMSALERVYGYTGGCGMIQGLAAGYFLWDLAVTSRNLSIFGVGMWAHAVCALCVFSFGFVRLSLPNPPVRSLLLDTAITNSFQFPRLRDPSLTSTAQHSFSTSSPPPFSTFTGFLISST